MYPDGLVFGLLNTSARIGDDRLYDQLRSLTISWSRYGYSGPIIEAGDVNGIFDKAAARGYRWCLMQSAGHLIGENWYPDHWQRIPMEAAIRKWVQSHEFLVAGPIIGDEEQGFGLDDQCLLVDLKRYESMGRPAFGDGGATEVECIRPVVGTSNGDGEERRVLTPSGARQSRVPRHPGWNLIDATLRGGMPVYDFGPGINRNRFYLDPANPEQLGRFSRYLGSAIKGFGEDRIGLGEIPQRFLRSVLSQVSNAQRGVFLWNLEPYDDVSAPEDFRPPVSTLYSVAAGLKPNIILENLGMDERTRVVFFDYSQKALEVRKLMVEQWDGEDYPSFVRYVLGKHPHPETFYQLWADLTPDSVAWDDVQRMWEAELRKWGGANVLREHWRRYRHLKHEYVPCNLLSDRGELLNRVRREDSAVIWWSNAFFTILSNWLYTIDQRREMYLSWIGELAAKNDRTFIYGSDFNNISVNHVRAGDYLRRLRSENYDYLHPLKVSKCQIRS
jgi:hypothetical protein